MVSWVFLQQVKSGHNVCIFGPVPANTKKKVPGREGMVFLLVETGVSGSIKAWWKEAPPPSKLISSPWGLVPMGSCSVATDIWSSPVTAHRQWTNFNCDYSSPLMSFGAGASRQSLNRPELDWGAHLWGPPGHGAGWPQADQLHILTRVIAGLLFWAKSGFMLSSEVNVPLRVIC